MIISNVSLIHFLRLTCSPLQLLGYKLVVLSSLRHSIIAAEKQAAVSSAHFRRWDWHPDYNHIHLMYVRYHMRISSLFHLSQEVMGDVRNETTRLLLIFERRFSYEPWRPNQNSLTTSSPEPWDDEQPSIRIQYLTRK